MKLCCPNSTGMCFWTSGRLSAIPWGGFGSCCVLNGNSRALRFSHRGCKGLEGNSLCSATQEIKLSCSDRLGVKVNWVPGHHPWNMNLHEFPFPLGKRIFLSIGKKKKTLGSLQTESRDLICCVPRGNHLTDLKLLSNAKKMMLECRFLVLSTPSFFSFWSSFVYMALTQNFRGILTVVICWSYNFK